MAAAMIVHSSTGSSTATSGITLPGTNTAKAPAVIAPNEDPTMLQTCARILPFRMSMTPKVVVRKVKFASA